MEMPGQNQKVKKLNVLYGEVPSQKIKNRRNELWNQCIEEWFNENLKIEINLSDLEHFIRRSIKILLRNLQNFIKNYKENRKAINEEIINSGEVINYIRTKTLKLDELLKNEIFKIIRGIFFSKLNSEIISEAYGNIQKSCLEKLEKNKHLKTKEVLQEFFIETLIHELIKVINPIANQDQTNQIKFLIKILNLTSEQDQSDLIQVTKKIESLMKLS